MVKSEGMNTYTLLQLLGNKMMIGVWGALHIERKLSYPDENTNTCI